MVAAPPTPSYSGSSARLRVLPRLRILQWNIEGWRSSVADLDLLCQRHHPDIVLLQETKLRPADSAPSVNGYTCVREDRRAGLSERRFGGGLATLVRSEVPYRVLGSRSVGGPESLSIAVSTTEGEIQITNVYRPPTRVGDALFDPSSLPSGPRAFIGGDFNAHSPLWDPVQPEDAVGQGVVDWLGLSGLQVLNDGSATRVNRVTGGLSSPDLSLAPSGWLSRAEWEVLQEGGSDHSPLLCSLDLRPHARTLPVRRVWDWPHADWDGFLAASEARLVDFDASGPLDDVVKRWTGAVLSAAEEAIGRKVLSNSRRPGWSRAVREAIRDRNRLRRGLPDSREEWVAACRRVRELVVAEKARRWASYVEDACSGHADMSRAWRVCRHLDGKRGGAPGNQNIVYQGAEWKCDGRKADAFCKEYASISRLCLSQEERRMDKRSARDLVVRASGSALPDPFSMGELIEALGHLRKGGAAGPDGVPPELLSRLGPGGRASLLACFNRSWTECYVPQSWRRAIIVPILKAGKSPSEVSSYRPVSLTSVIDKTLERMIHARMYELAESRGMLDPRQAGFRRGRCAEDQVLRVAQAISDGFQERPRAHRTVLALLDFSRAFDTVRRGQLLRVLLDKGLPPRMVLWVAAFLRNRVACVRWGDALSRSRVFRRGVPQGSVLSPLLFLFAIDGLAGAVGPGLGVSLFADDVALWASDPVKERAAARAEAGVRAVANWSSGSGLRLNLQKCTVSFFSTAASEARWSPSVTVEGHDLSHDPTPVFLGVAFDWCLSFRRQAERVAARVAARCRLFSAVASREWGWSRQVLRNLFMALVRGSMDYCGAAWQPWLSPSGVGVLERAHSRAIRAVTGQLASSPLEALQCELQVPPYSAVRRFLAAKAAEKARRLPPDHPRSLAWVGGGTRHRLARSSWRKLAGEVLASCGLLCAPPSPSPFPAAPLPSAPRLEVFPDLLEAPDAVTAAALRVNRHRPAVCVYTDGSAAGGTSAGAALPW